MTKKITLNKLTEEIIRVSKRPFTINDFAKNLETLWEKQISDSSLKKVRQIDFAINDRHAINQYINFLLGLFVLSSS